MSNPAAAKTFSVNPTVPDPGGPTAIVRPLRSSTFLAPVFALATI